VKDQIPAKSMEEEVEQAKVNEEVRRVQMTYHAESS